MDQNTMVKTQFEMADIQVGDEILFNNSVNIEHNLFWKVINKISNSRLMVEIREMGYSQKIMIEINDVIILQKNTLTTMQLG